MQRPSTVAATFILILEAFVPAGGAAFAQTTGTASGQPDWQRAGVLHVTRDISSVATVYQGAHR